MSGPVLDRQQHHLWLLPSASMSEHERSGFTQFDHSDRLDMRVAGYFAGREDMKVWKRTNDGLTYFTPDLRIDQQDH